MSEDGQQDAKDIAEHLLEVTGTALMTGDFAGFAEVFDIPQTMSVQGKRTRVETRADLQRMFENMHQHFIGIGVTDLVRICEAADFVDDTLIRSTHVSHLMKRGTRIMDPYPVVSNLVRRKDGWKVGSADYDLDLNGGQARAINQAQLMATRPDIKSDPEAMKIYQANLDAVSRAIMDGPAEDALPHLRAPYYMRTPQGMIAFNNRQDILDTVNATHLSLRVQGATAYVRTARHAYFRNKDEIEGLHITRILRGNQLMTPAYENRMKLRRAEDGNWQVVHAEHVMQHAAWPIVPLDRDHGRLEDVNPLSQADEIALMVYREYLAALTQANMTHDFDRWVELCRFPHTVKIDFVTRIIEGPEDIRDFFDMVSDQLRDKPGIEMKRKGEFATFLDSHTIRGYHLTTITADAGPVIQPVHGRFTIALDGGEWRMIETVNAIANTKFPYTDPIVSDTLGSELDQKEDPKQ